MTGTPQIALGCPAVTLKVQVTASPRLPGVSPKLKTGTSADSSERVEEGHEQVHEHGQVERDAAPEGHVAGAPVQHGLGCGDETGRVRSRPLPPARPPRGTFVPSFHHSKKRSCVSKVTHRLMATTDWFISVWRTSWNRRCIWGQGRGEKPAPVNTLSYGTPGVPRVHVLRP